MRPILRKVSLATLMLERLCPGVEIRTVVCQGLVIHDALFQFSRSIDRFGRFSVRKTFLKTPRDFLE